jgi:hypothetical protein
MSLTQLFLPLSGDHWLMPASCTTVNMQVKYLRLSPPVVW